MIKTLNKLRIKGHYIGTSLVVQWLRLHTPNAGDPGSIPGQGSRSHMLQLRVCMLQLKDPSGHNEGPVHGKKDPRAATKSRRGQINISKNYF